MKMVISSKMSAGVNLVEEIVGQVGARGYSDGVCFAIRLSLDEALANAIRHGNSNDPAKNITIEYTLTDEVFRVTVCDQGTGFDPNSLPDPRLDENLNRPCGRGVMLMRVYMTEVQYNEQGNCVTMVKRKDCPRPQLDLTMDPAGQSSTSLAARSMVTRLTVEMSDSVTPSSASEPAPTDGSRRLASTDCAESADEPSGEPPANSADGARQFRIELSLRCAETDPPVAGWLEDHLTRIGALERVTEGCLSVAIVGGQEMAALHSQYKQIDGPTDVLSFDLGGGDGPLDAELVLCRDVAIEQAGARGHAARLELLLYAVHGLLHVLGYDDATADHAAAMHRREDELLEAVGLEPTYGRSELAQP